MKIEVKSAPGLEMRIAFDTSFACRKFEDAWFSVAAGTIVVSVIAARQNVHDIMSAIILVPDGTRRRKLEEGTDTLNLRRVQEADTAIFEGEAYTGNIEAISILAAMTMCLDDGFTHHPCLGSPDTMTMTFAL
jgi:hypothetical protein